MATLTFTFYRTDITLDKLNICVTLSDALPGGACGAVLQCDHNSHERENAAPGKYITQCTVEQLLLSFQPNLIIFSSHFGNT